MPDFANNLVKAIKLEFSHLTSNMSDVFAYFMIPLIIISLFFIMGSAEISWSKDVGYKTYYDFYAPVIFSTIVYFISIQSTVLRIVGERAPYGTLDRELLALPKHSVFIGKLITNTLMAFFQASLLFFAGYYLFNVYIGGNPAEFLFILLLSSFVGLSMGLCFSVFSKSKEFAIQLVPLVVLLLLLFSGFLIKIEVMPLYLQEITKLTPLYLSYNSLSEIGLNGNHIINVVDNIFFLFIWFMFFTFSGMVKFLLEE